MTIQTGCSISYGTNTRDVSRISVPIITDLLAAAPMTEGEPAPNPRPASSAACLRRRADIAASKRVARCEASGDRDEREHDGVDLDVDLADRLVELADGRAIIGVGSGTDGVIGRVSSTSGGYRCVQTSRALRGIW